MSTKGRYALSIFFALTLAWLWGASVRPAHAQAPARPPTPGEIVVKELAVQGNRRIQEAVILGRVSAKVGGLFVPARLADDIRAIFALGFFDDVQAKVEDFEGGVKLTFVVTERPFVRDLNFVGNKQLDSGTLQEKIDIKLGTVYNPVEVTRAAEKLKEAYEEQGYFEAGVTPDVAKLPDGDVSVTFRVAEGRKMTIDKIVIEGAQGLKPEKIKEIMLTQEREFFILRGTVQRQKLDQDIERVVTYYNDNGYIQARVESVDTQVDRANARVTIKIVVAEGPQFRVGGLDVTGNKVLPVEELRRRIILKPDDVYSRTKLQDSVKAITDVYGTIGRAAADVNPQIALDVPNRKVNITLEITEGPEVFVERINISGNTRSQEKILRREIPMATITASRATEEKIRTLSITQPDAYIVLNYADQDIQIHRRAAQEYTLNRESIRYRQASFVERLFVHKDNPLKLEIRHLVSAARASQATGQVDLFETEDLRSLAVALEIERMIREGRGEVAWPKDLPWSAASP